MREGIPELTNEWISVDFFGVPYVAKGMIGRGERWDNSLAKAVMLLHDGLQRTDEEGEPIPDMGKPPKVLFITATSAIPYAIAMKEAWKTAYPNEKFPKSFFIDVSKRREWRLKEGNILNKEEIEQINLQQIEKLRQIGNKYVAFNNAAVFDEFVNFGTTLREVRKQLQEAGFNNVNFMYGWWGHVRSEEGIIEKFRPVIRKEKRLSFNISAESQSLVRDMGTIGKEMGKQILGHMK